MSFDRNLANCKGYDSIQRTKRQCCLEVGEVIKYTVQGTSLDAPLRVLPLKHHKSVFDKGIEMFKPCGHVDI